MSANNNPYAPPQSNVDVGTAVSDSGFIEDGRTRPAGDGVRWITQAIKMFFAPLWWKWVVVMIIYFAVTTCIAVVPFLGIANLFIGPILSAGIAYAADSQRRTGDFAIGDSFKGFNAAGQLLLLGLVVLGACILMGVLAAVSLGLDGLRMLQVADPTDPYAILGMVWKVVLIAFVVAVPLIAATVFAPALIMLHGLPAFRAMKSSFVGTFKNVLSGLVCAIALFAIFIAVVVVAIPVVAILGSGMAQFALPFVSLLIFAPVGMLLPYTMYRSIFTKPA
jgi:hypothetical protein